MRELNLKGVYFQKEFKRFYPNNDLAAQVLGYVGTDDTGLGGLEQEFDDEMHGTPGHMLTAVDARRHVMGSVESEPLPGENLVLTIDSNIQYMAERALDEQMAKVKAAARHGGGAGPAHGADSGAGDLAALQSQRLAAHGAGLADQSCRQRCL